MVLALEKVAFQDLIQYIKFTCYPFLTLFLNTADSASSLGELSSQDSHFSQDPVQMGQANSGGSCPCDSRSSSEYFEPDPYYGAYTTDLYEGEPTREEAWHESDIRDAKQDYADRQASAATESTGNDYMS